MHRRVSPMRLHPSFARRAKARFASAAADRYARGAKKRRACANSGRAHWRSEVTFVNKRITSALAQIIASSFPRSSQAAGSFAGPSLPGFSRRTSVVERAEALPFYRRTADDRNNGSDFPLAESREFIGQNISTGRREG